MIPAAPRGGQSVFEKACTKLQAFAAFDEDGDGQVGHGLMGHGLIWATASWATALHRLRHPYADIPMQNPYGESLWRIPMENPYGESLWRIPTAAVR